MSSFDVVIVGGGIVGSASAHYLSKRGCRVLLLDQSELPNPWGASGDHARIFRLTFGKDLFYTELAVKALELWKEFEKEAREELYAPTGMLELAPKDKGYEKAGFDALSQLRLPVEQLDAAAMRERYRIFNARAFRYAVFHPDGGILWAQRAAAAFCASAQKRHAVVRTGVRIVSVVRGKEGVRELRDAQGRSWRGGSYLFAAGAWSKDILRPSRIPLKVSRQSMLYLRPPQHQGQYRPAHCPVFSSSSARLHGFPVHIHGFMKLGDDRLGAGGKPGPCQQAVPPAFERACRRFLKAFLPDVAGFTEAEGKVCHYASTPDGDFVADRLPGAPNAYVATGLPGHGFQFGPLLGSVMAEWIALGRTGLNLSRFRFGRFR